MNTRIRRIRRIVFRELRTIIRIALGTTLGILLGIAIIGVIAQ